MLNQSYIYSWLKIPLYISGSIKAHRIYTRDFIYPAYYYEALWHDSSLLKRFNSNNEYALYLTRFTYGIMFGCYKQKQRYVFWYEKWQKQQQQQKQKQQQKNKTKTKTKKHILVEKSRWTMSECVERVEIYKINYYYYYYFFFLRISKSFMQRIIQKRILKLINTASLLYISVRVVP